jgi:penicillin G amidase
MIAVLFATSLALPQTPAVSRDTYGVPVVRAKTIDEAMYWSGYAVAQDRMWQMEMSRRQARSRISEVLGSKYVQADREQAAQFYTDTELRQQFDRLPKNVRMWFSAYAKGVNARIAEGKLPSEYEINGFQPKAWDELDSVAITIRLVQIFGRGGAGEIRNFALLKYLEGQAKIKTRALDVLDDFAWQNDPRAVPTCLPEDDTVKPPRFPSPNRAETEKHLAQLPSLTALELLPGVRVVQLEDSKREAARLATPFKSGSYAVAVSKNKSASGNALLLSGPQMGFSNPSIVHEISLHAPGLDVAGMDLPGVPGVLIGATPDAAWGLTTGVADTEDIYLLKEGKQAIIPTEFTIPVKGAEPEKFVRRDTEYGPIVYEVKSKGVQFARKRAYQGYELQSYEAVSGLWFVKTRKDFDKSVRRASMNFNCFVALKSGEIGWRYLGWVPNRVGPFDPRFPLPPTPEAAWQGMIPFEQMPNVWNPKQGFIANWNNKPAAWWPNLDTPAWGEAFRNGSLLSQLRGEKLTTESLAKTVSGIGQTQSNWHAMSAFAQSGPLANFQGRLEIGATMPSVYNRFVVELRNELFLGATGGFVTPDNFALVAQPDIMLKALRGETKFDYLAGRNPNDLVATALAKAQATAGNTPYQPGTIPVPSGQPIPFRDRGTYIQIIELGKYPTGKNVLTPGVSENGPWSNNQSELARTWTYKAMTIR